MHALRPLPVHPQSRPPSKPIKAIELMLIPHQSLPFGTRLAFRAILLALPRSLPGSVCKPKAAPLLSSGESPLKALLPFAALLALLFARIPASALDIQKDMAGGPAKEAPKDPAPTPAPTLDKGD